MKLLRVSLGNIRSHDNTVVKFSDGFNCIVGGVGQGKSSILYGIDFALIGEPYSRARSYEYLLREDASAGKVSLLFEHDGASYELTRVLRRVGRGAEEVIRQDAKELRLTKDGVVLASGKVEAVREQLASITGLGSALYRDVAWVSQEGLKSLLVQRPADRQRVIDELLGLLDFEDAYVGMWPIERAYEVEGKGLILDTADLEDVRARYDSEARMLIEIENRTAELEKDVARFKGHLEDVEGRLRDLEALRRRVEDLRSKEVDVKSRLISADKLAKELEEEVKRIKMEVEEAKGRVNFAEKEIKGVEDRLRSFDLPPLIDLEVLGIEEERVGEEIRRVEGSIAIINEDEDRVVKHRELMEKAENCPLCEQPLKGDYKGRLIERLDLRIREDRERLGSLSKELKELRDKHRLLREQMAKLRDLQFSLEWWRKAYHEKLMKLEEDSRSIGFKRGEVERLRRELDEIREEISVFKPEDYERLRIERDSAFKNYQRSLSSLEASKEALRIQQARLQEVFKKLKDKEAKKARLKFIEEVCDFISLLRNMYKGVRPSLRGEYLDELRISIQAILDRLGRPEERLFVDFDENYTPTLIIAGRRRDLESLSGGERTLLALAIRIGLGKMVFTARTGRPLDIIILDEPTESIGAEDGSIDRVAEVLKTLKELKQTMVVTHSEQLASHADHIIRVYKEAGKSQVEIAPPT